MMRLYVDIETRWSIDLKKHGTVRCASDKFAGINCLAYAVDDQPVEILDYYDCLDLMNGRIVFGGPERNKAGIFWLLYSGAPHVVAHNAAFEIECLARIPAMVTLVDGTVTRSFNHGPDRWIDTMAKAAYYGYPRSLDDAAKATGCTLLKDIGGKGVMLKLVQGLHTPEDAPEEFQRLYKYCANDVEVMRQIDKKIPDLPPDVQANWALDAEINMRGVPVDLQMIKNAVTLREELAVAADNEMAFVTGGAAQSVGQVGKIQEWLAGRNVHMPDMTADSVEKMLSNPPAPLDKWERRTLELRQESGLSSLAKYQKILDYQVDGRLHQMFDWYGTHPGRPTGRGPQVVNLPRSERSEYWADVIAETPWFISQLEAPMEKLKDAIRGAICAPDGDELVWMDMSQFQARATFWLAKEPGIAVFTTSDPYCTHGAKMFNRPINKKDDPNERQAAKASLLSFSFLGGIGAGQLVAQNYHIDFSALADMILPRANELEIMEGTRNYKYYRDKMPPKPLNEREGVAVDILKQWFRRDYPRIEQFGDELEYAFINGGVAGRVTIEVDGDTRILTLPSGRQLFYRKVRIEGRGYSFEMRGVRHSLWKGQLIENCALGTEVDVINWYKEQAKHLAPLVHQCYDELTWQVYKLRVQQFIADLTALTQTKPDFCAGLPLGFDIQHGRRYGK